MTDGAHNTPAGTSMLEAVPDYQAANTNIYTLGVGSGSELDIAGLEDLAQQTGGTAFTEADGAQVFEIQARMIEINNLIRGGLVTTIAEIVPDTKQRSGFQLDEKRSPKKRPTLEELLDKARVKTPLELVHSKVIGNGHAMVAYHHVEDGAQSATFTLTFEKPLRLWLYLLDPDGQEVNIHASNVQFVSSNHRFEFAKVTNPKAGKWTIVGIRPKSGVAGRAQAITGIQHKQLAVTARAWSRGKNCPVKVTATARFGRPLTGYSAIALVHDIAGKRHTIRLHDDDGVGIYNAYFDVPKGHYRGTVEFTSRKNTYAAGAQHAIVHAEKEDVVYGTVKCPEFQRSVPISFIVGKINKPKPGKEERKFLDN
jgi:hypothetical protein